MKQKFYSLLLTALLGMTGMNAWAQLSTTTIDGKTYYQIAFAEDLAEFASLVNGGDFTANAILTDDIDMADMIEMNGWTAIGDWSTVDGANACFKGHFDGQGHTITGFNATSSHNYYGIFGVVSDCVIENFTIEGTIVINSDYGYAGGIAAYARDKTPTIRNVHSKVNISSTSTASTPRIGGILGGVSAQNSYAVIDRCTYSGTLNANDKGGNYGGIVGYILNNANVSTDITNCLFDGKLQGTVNTNSAQYGGLIGYTRKGIVSVKNCLSIGTFEYAEGNNMNIGQFIGRLTFDSGTSGCTFANNYYVDKGYALYGTSSGGAAKGTAPVEVTAAQLAGGEIAYALNGNQSTDVNWFQVLGNAVFYATQYIVTTNGTPRDPETADAQLVDNGDGTYNFMLPNFVLHTGTGDLEAGDVTLEGITINDDGTFSKEGTFSVPDGNIPALLSSQKDNLQNLTYTLAGKVNGDKLYANLSDLNVNLDYPYPSYAISVEIGTDDFEAAAPVKGDAHPLPYGTAVVYPAGRQHCDGTAYTGVTGYTNTPSVQDDHDFADGFCTYCGAFDENYLTANADGFFEIGTANQLKWFAIYANTIDHAANAVLTADIAFTEAWTTPIGLGSGNNTGTTAYTGTFDGQGFSITGFSMESAGRCGLFGDVTGATIKDFSISGTITITGSYGGGVVAWPTSSTIKNVHSSLEVSVPKSGVHHVGGVVGSARGGNTIDRCSFTGSMTVAAGSTDNFAGIAAYITSGDKVTNCANYGNVTFSDAGCAAGGLVGYVNSTSATVKNSMTVGTIHYDGEGDPKYGAAILGRTKGFSSALVTNNYWLEGSAYAASKMDNGTDPLATESSTSALFASGEVAIKLGIAWRQNLGTDTYPVLDPTHNVVAEITAAGYATLYVPDADVTIPAGVTAYTGEFVTNPNNGKQYLALNAVSGFIPAQTAVVLKGAEGIYEFAYSAPVPDVALGVYNNEVDGSEALVKGWAAPIDGNVLKGTADDIDAAGKYILAQPAGEPVCFYQAESGIIKAGKAYLEVPAGTDVKAIQFLFPDDDPTGISDLNGQWSMVNGQSIYNLAGQRVGKMQKGVNVVNGKKVLY